MTVCPCVRPSSGRWVWLRSSCPAPPHHFGSCSNPFTCGSEAASCRSASSPASPESTRSSSLVCECQFSTLHVYFISFLKRVSPQQRNHQWNSAVRQPSTRGRVWKFVGSSDCRLRLGCPHDSVQPEVAATGLAARAAGLLGENIGAMRKKTLEDQFESSIS